MFWALFAFVFDAFVDETEPNVRRRAKAANVSSRPEKFKTNF